MKKLYWTLFSLIAILCISLFSFKKISGDINATMIKNAAELIGLEFSDKEIDLMVEDLEDKRKTFNELRADTITNDIAPATVFNPLPIGFQIPQRQIAIKYQGINGKKVSMPQNRDELAFYNVHELAHLIKTQQISCVELTNFFIERLKKHDQSLHCVITIMEKRALERAQWADDEIKTGRYLGILHGIPYGIKDLLATKDYKTTWGATPYKDQVFDYDAQVITNLDKKGAIPIVKLSMGALAWGDVWYKEKTRNPWAPEEGSSGSSAGSASAVAAGLLPFALGTETLGSIVSPSTVCGTTGLRPTFGMVSRHGAMALSWTMDKIGPIARSAEDCAVVFDGMRGKDTKDLSTIAAPFNYNGNKGVDNIKVGYLKSNFEGDYPFKSNDAEVLDKLMSLGIELIPMELPKAPNITFILEAEAAAAFDLLTRSNEDDLLVRQIKNAWPNVFRQARFIPAVEYINANRRRSQLIQEMDEVMKKVDIYIHPSWASSSLVITNLTGHPSVTVPNGLKDGKPTSITFTGKLFGEGKLLRVAKFFQDNTDYHLDHPEGY